MRLRNPTPAALLKVSRPATITFSPGRNIVRWPDITLVLAITYLRKEDLELLE
jgi:hypothetical protein